eukprot:1160871-Pelagomonas_calceolata.AAC.7
MLCSLATPSSSGAGDMCVNASVRSAADNIVAPSYTVAAAAAAAGSSPMAEIQRAHPGAQVFILLQVRSLHPVFMNNFTTSAVHVHGLICHGALMQARSQHVLAPFSCPVFFRRAS